MISLAEVLRRVEDVASTHCRSSAEEVDRDARWPEPALRALEAAGLGGLVVPAAQGGLGHGLSGVARVCEVLARECPSTALCFGMHCVGAAVLAAKATASQQDRYLDPICRGKHLTTLALSEPGSGAHFFYPQTQLAAAGPDLFRLNGVKSFVTSGGFADSYVVSTMAADPQAPPDQFSCVIVLRENPGLHWGGPWGGLGMRGNAARTVELRDAPLPREDLLGREGDQLWYAFHVIAPYFLMAMSGCYLGIAQAAFDEAVNHLRDRRYTHSGSRLSEVPVLQHRLGELWSVVERTRRLVYHAAEEGDLGGPDAMIAVCASKAEVADAAVRLANEALTLVGGRGYKADSRLSRLLRDARASHVMAPTTDMLRGWVGRILLDQKLLGE